MLTFGSGQNLAFGTVESLDLYFVLSEDRGTCGLDFPGTTHLSIHRGETRKENQSQKGTQPGPGQLVGGSFHLPWALKPSADRGSLAEFMAPPVKPGGSQRGCLVPVLRERGDFKLK